MNNRMPGRLTLGFAKYLVLYWSCCARFSSNRLRKPVGLHNISLPCTYILCQVLLEPYARAYYFGSERVSKRYGTEPEQDTCTYKDIKALCEQPFSGYYLFSFIADLVQNACHSSEL